MPLPCVGSDERQHCVCCVVSNGNVDATSSTSCVCTNVDQVSTLATARCQRVVADDAGALCQRCRATDQWMLLRFRDNSTSCSITSIDV